MRALVHRIGLYRVAALLIGCALAVEVLRVQVLPASGVVQIACTMAEVLFVALALGAFVLARRRQPAR